MSAMNEVTQAMIDQLNLELTSSFLTAPTGCSLPSAHQAVNQSILGNLFHQPAPETPEAIARLASILASLSSDVPRGNGKFFDASGTPVKDFWLGVVWAVAATGWPQGKDMVRAWSQQSLRYDAQGFEKAWNDFDPTHANPVGMGSLIMFAKANGWTDSGSTAVPVVGPQTGYKVLGRADILSMPVADWRVKKVFPKCGIGAIYGPSASGKSFLALDLACAIAEGVAWFGYKTSACPVTYVVLEGEAGLAARAKAWESAKSKSLPDDFGVIAQPFRLTDLGDLTELMAAIPKSGVVFLDTLNRAAPTSDENSSKEMGEILEAVKNLQLATGGLVVLVHHTGKDVSKGMRGHSSLFAALDGAIEVHRSDERRSWSVAKSKDADDGGVVHFRLKHHVLGQDVDGEDITSCTVEADTAQLMVMREPSGSKQKLALAAIRRALPSATNSGKCESGTGTPCLSVNEATAAVAAELTTDPVNKRNNKAKSLIEALLGGGYICSGIDDQGDGWIWKP
jgi:hypothetical protein